MEGYVSAVCSLWSTQKALGNNSYDTPRGPLVKALLDSRERGEAKRRRAEYQDRGALTLQDGYNAETFSRVVRGCWLSTTRSGIIQQDSAPSTLSGLRTAVDLLFGHNILLRGETRRTIQLPDLFSLELKNEGPSRCPALVLITD